VRVAASRYVAGAQTSGTLELGQLVLRRLLVRSDSTIAVLPAPSSSGWAGPTSTLNHFARQVRKCGVPAMARVEVRDRVVGLVGQTSRRLVTPRSQA
jgi:hypothetical protein